LNGATTGTLALQQLAVASHPWYFARRVKHEIAFAMYGLWPARRTSCCRAF